MDAELNGIAAALSNAILRDGTGKPTANIDWNNKRITNLAAPIDAQDAARKNEIDTESAARTAGDSANATAAASALTAANTAQSTANAAGTSAATAQSTANAAQTSANTAQTTANSASSAASNAQSTANTAAAKVANITGFEAFITAISTSGTSGQKDVSISGLGADDQVIATFYNSSYSGTNAAIFTLQTQLIGGTTVRVFWVANTSLGAGTLYALLRVIKQSSTPPTI
jgi:hypothetical protein